MLSDEKIKELAHKAAEGEDRKRQFHADASWLRAFADLVVKEARAHPDLVEIEEDFQKCYELSRRMRSHFPETPGVWVGTVSERLTLLFEKALENTKSV
jgi:hypothetical protein